MPPRRTLFFFIFTLGIRSGSVADGATEVEETAAEELFGVSVGQLLAYTAAEMLLEETDDGISLEEYAAVPGLLVEELETLHAGGVVVMDVALESILNFEMLVGLSLKNHYCLGKLNFLILVYCYNLSLHIQVGAFLCTDRHNCSTLSFLVLNKFSSDDASHNMYP